MLFTEEPLRPWLDVPRDHQRRLLNPYMRGAQHRSCARGGLRRDLANGTISWRSPMLESRHTRDVGLARGLVRRQWANDNRYALEGFRIDGPRFDHLARSFAANVSRRDTLKGSGRRAARGAGRAERGRGAGRAGPVRQHNLRQRPWLPRRRLCLLPLPQLARQCLQRRLPPVGRQRSWRGRLSAAPANPRPIDGCIPEDGPCPPFQSRVAGVCVDPCTVDTCSGSCGSCAATLEGVALCFGPVSVQCFVECASNADCQDPLLPDCLLTGLCQAGRSFCTKVTCTEP